MQEFVERVTEGQDLTQSEARAASTAVFEEATEAQIGALLTALRAKGETEAEIAGFAQGMHEAARTITPDREPLVDTCGTGGDDYNTINVSTTSAIVAAGAGVPIAKHGNYSVSSSSGSADVLEVAGVDVEAEPPAVEDAIEDDGIGFMLAPVFHPAMKAVIGPRKELGMRTIFNVLGPLTNPAGADAQVVGVYDPELVPILASALARMDVERALVVHGAGTDEIAIHGETTVAEVEGDHVEKFTVEPADLGLSGHAIDDIAGGTPEENATDLRGIVAGDVTGAKRDVILANAGAAIYVAGEADSLSEGATIAREAIESGAAATKLKHLCSGAADSETAAEAEPSAQ
ncbi:anthranilate phosphoribosyltransferase [Natrialba magadii ATCC 43099]|uniref:Anthranilate phosphoribosyltransferase n=1 Tax=Natrialba magadii (strain ATCC 43099 / DSM 3394 / CCM 3739 / CIP 104546 / IAM 13178 / JCM 8861 / NBRC 102185 / NCIMB 2190 / MS3) TaxID=547559 RepID=D3SVU4_NATMM|nr:anthranilate phosphoribosyltransferase [Natrialba magadii]ADD03663.1 anthranilate phosphoribosyltransferase [Natrialba magadii ATCC 43099]ELY34429.1 anthranilate phosphoribosyltransferase [Natrialba magadii ATCC 43099]